MPCNDINGCFHTGEVAVGYFPYKVSVVQVSVRVAPEDNAKKVVTLKKNQRFGVQSTRNPSESAKPKQRPPKNGYVWGYANADGRSGWIKLSCLVPDDSDEVWADGPAGADFQVGAQEPKRGRKPSSCKGRAGKDERVIDVEDTYLRYAPQSTPFHYLVRGDRVRESWRSYGKYVCVQVVASKTCPKGTRGWVPYASLENRG